MIELLLIIHYLPHSFACFCFAHVIKLSNLRVTREKINVILLNIFRFVSFPCQTHNYSPLSSTSRFLKTVFSFRMRIASIDVNWYNTKRHMHRKNSKLLRNKLFTSENLKFSDYTPPHSDTLNFFPLTCFMLITYEATFSYGYGNWTLLIEVVYVPHRAESRGFRAVHR
jgi:hypothetical protein